MTNILLAYYLLTAVCDIKPDVLNKCCKLKCFINLNETIKSSLASDINDKIEAQTHLVMIATAFFIQALLLSRESMKRATSPLDTD